MHRLQNGFLLIALGAVVSKSEELISPGALLRKFGWLLNIRAAPQVNLGAPTQFEQIYEQFRNFTMIPRTTYLENLQLIDQVRAVQGCVVECGVWRGGMIAGIAKVLGPDRSYFLFDSFEGLPPAKEVDGESALTWQRNTLASDYYDNCRAPPEFAEQAMAKSGAKHFRLIKGWFDQTLPKSLPSEPIAILRLDADWYDSTMVCLRTTFDRITPGGLIILDDYYTWDGCSRALHDFLSERRAVERIRDHGTVCFLEKKANQRPESGVPFP
jgi:O-methyltransferase